MLLVVSHGFRTKFLNGCKISCHYTFSHGHMVFLYFPSMFAYFPCIFLYLLLLETNCKDKSAAEQKSPMGACLGPEAPTARAAERGHKEECSLRKIQCNLCWEIFPLWLGRSHDCEGCATMLFNPIDIDPVDWDFQDFFCWCYNRDESLGKNNLAEDIDRDTVDEDRISTN